MPLGLWACVLGLAGARVLGGVSCPAVGCLWAIRRRRRSWRDLNKWGTGAKASHQPANSTCRRPAFRVRVPSFASHPLHHHPPYPQLRFPYFSSNRPPSWPSSTAPRWTAERGNWTRARRQPPCRGRRLRRRARQLQRRRRRTGRRRPLDEDQTQRAATQPGLRLSRPPAAN